jgi:hypothetical protein
MFAVEELLQILRHILRQTQGDHLREELFRVGRQRLEPVLIPRTTRELVAAFAHGVPALCSRCHASQPARSDTPTGHVFPVLVP